MPIIPIPNSDKRYYLVSFDKDGVERTDDPGGVMSDLLVAKLEHEAISDVFIFNHGWMGDISDAQWQYNAWFGALFAAQPGVDSIQKMQDGFNPVFIGLHWPSKPFGDEQFAGGDSFALPVGATALTVEALADVYAHKYADIERARAALHTIFAYSKVKAVPYELSPELRHAFEELNAAAHLGDNDIGGYPGEDREPFDPDSFYEAVTDDTSFGGIGGGLLQAVAVFSFWQMKGRAARIGETGGNAFLHRLVAARPEARLHLMGHSFGCIVVSAMIAGKPGAHLSVPVHSATLVEGALSCWAYCADIPLQSGQPGYFHTIVRDGLIHGPLISIYSLADRAVGLLYPAGAGIAGQSSFDEIERKPKKYSALGAFGAQAVHAMPLDMKTLAETYPFEVGGIYNIDGSRYINQGGFIEGAHNDIAHPEVGHAVWAAAATQAVSQ